jgi:hypothetical protein
MWFRNLLIVLHVVGIAVTCARVGKPKSPDSPFDAAVNVVFGALLIWGILTYWP